MKGQMMLSSFRSSVRRSLAAGLAALLLTAPTVAVAQPGVTPAAGGPTAGPAPTPTPGPGPTGANPLPRGPATGPGLGLPAPTPAPRPLVKTDPINLTPNEQAALKDAESEYDRFVVAADAHQDRMKTIAKHEFDSRTGDLEKRYAARIAKTETDLKTHQAETIARLEKFVHDHQHHETFTPDAMFRLADLYLDAANDDVDARAAAADAARAAGNVAPDQAELIADYSRSLQLWQDILDKFPNYRQLPSTLYLLAYYSKTKDPRRSLQLFLALGCANKYSFKDAPPAAPTREEAIKRTDRKALRDPYGECTPLPGADTELVRHSWVRGVADYQFTVPGELDDTIAAYLKVANGGNDSPLYAEALYKLAWSYYKRDYQLESIKRFDESVKLYDALVASGGVPALELRDESIQYIAVGFTDGWDGETDSNPPKAFDRAKEFYKGRENEPHVRDVWVAMGHAFAELQAWDQAVDSYRLAIGPPWELNSKNPNVHQEIVNAFESKGDKFAADQAAAELATRYSPGSAWYQANSTDRDAMESQRRIAERALYAATRNTHAEATRLRKEFESASKKDPAAKAEYLALYTKAVELYRTFIDQYPDSDYVYEFTYLQGEALYFSERYPEAIVEYKWVRDHKDLGTTYFLDAAASVVQSYEAEAARQVAAGTIAALKVPTSSELKALPQPLQPQPIPDIYVQLQNEWDNYQNVVPDPKSAPTQGINAALVSLAYLHVDDAVTRFEKVMDKFCGLPESAKAKDGLLSIYQATDQLDAFENTNKKFIATKCGDDKAVALALSQNRSIQFQRAADLFTKKQYVPAADGFYRFYRSAPPGDKDLPTALYNAAINFKLGDRPKTAIALFKEFTSNNTKPFRESPYYLDAMRLTAATYQGAFDYDNAISTYLSLYDAARKAKALGIKPPDPIPGAQPLTLEQISLDALYNAAFAAELNRDFKRAKDLYMKYGREEPDRRKQDRAVWSIAGIHRQAGEVSDMVEMLDRWRGKFGKDPGNEDDFVQSFYDTAALWKRKGNTPQAKKAGQETIDAWKARGSQKNTRGARLAGEWALEFAEEFYAATFEPYAIKTAAKTVAELNAQKKGANDVKTKTEDKYLALDAFGVVEYSMAAKVRYGDIQYGYAQKLSDAPIPKPIAANPDAVEAFEKTRDQNLTKFLAEAKGDWAEVLDVAKKNGLSNRWSSLANENLGREFPAEYTLLRQELTQGTEAP